MSHWIQSLSLGMRGAVKSRGKAGFSSQCCPPTSFRNWGWITNSNQASSSSPMQMRALIFTLQEYYVKNDVVKQIKDLWYSEQPKHGGCSYYYCYYFYCAATPVLTSTRRRDLPEYWHFASPCHIRQEAALRLGYSRFIANSPICWCHLYFPATWLEILFK